MIPAPTSSVAAPAMKNGIRQASPAPKTLPPSSIMFGAKTVRQRDAEGQSGDDDAHAEAALLDRRLLGDQAAVVGVEGALAQPGEHADGDEEDETGEDAAQQRRDAGPHEADRDQGPVAVAVAEVAAGPLGEHVAGEEQAADEPAERVGLRRVGQEGDVVADHPRHHRPGEGAVGGADRPTEQQPEPERAVWRPRQHEGMRLLAVVLGLHRSRLPSDYSGFACQVKRARTRPRQG